MTIWHERRGADLMLRGGGVVLMCVAWLLGTCLTSLVRRHAPHDVSPLELVTGMAMFGAASVGSVAVALGKHLFDTVAISERWAIRKS